jgi:hypothetical protein
MTAAASAFSNTITGVCEMDKRVNVASLPLVEALERARHGGRSILGNEDAVSEVYIDLWRKWGDANMPNACGQSDDEFSDLMDKCMSEFEAGLDETVRTVRDAVPSTPDPSEGEMSASHARLIIRALQWLSENISVDTSREDIDDYQMLVELGLGAIERDVETAERALMARRSDRASADTPSTS